MKSVKNKLIPFRINLFLTDFKTTSFCICYLITRRPGGYTSHDHIGSKSLSDDGIPGKLRVPLKLYTYKVRPYAKW